MEFIRFISLVSFMLQSFCNGQDSNPCISIHMCHSLDKLLKLAKLEKLDNISDTDMFDYLRSLKCNEFADYVSCPDIEGTETCTG